MLDGVKTSLARLQLEHIDLPLKKQNFPHREILSVDHQSAAVSLGSASPVSSRTPGPLAGLRS
jgi:hypothetical protein